MSSLSTLLHFPSPPSTLRSPIPIDPATILISDTLQAPADFVLLHFLGAFLKENQNVLFVGCGETVEHYKAIAKKTGVSLDSSLFTFHDALSTQSNTSDCSTLRPLFNALSSTLKGKERATGEGDESSESVVILDDLSALHWMGVELEEVGRFVRALQALSRKLRFSIVQLVHTTPSPSSSTPDDALFKLLYPSADLWIQVRGLQSGRSGDVSGELAFVPSTLWDKDEAFPRTEPSKELQYKLGDAAVTFFPKGTGEGFL